MGTESEDSYDFLVDCHEFLYKMDKAYEEEISEAVEAGEMTKVEVSDAVVTSVILVCDRMTTVLFDPVESSSIESIPVVSEFKEVFPTDLPCMPPDEDIDLCIDLEYYTLPISIPTYCKTPYEEEPVAILDREVRKLRTKEIKSVKVQWKHRPIEKTIWETEKDIRDKYPQLFDDSGTTLTLL
ncbi:hypothetical protein MTR67_003243 [Solanum verrucosum]|uniref:Uncharacterized protein n=1 Tax=Solanum verrucosum TaxID=315347 RepID=A0AAF0PS28_SOLVR|nr:hypothetical protein MTR67_003243 [Solanum verrucosum]